MENRRILYVAHLKNNDRVEIYDNNNRQIKDYNNGPNNKLISYLSPVPEGVYYWNYQDKDHYDEKYVGELKYYDNNGTRIYKMNGKGILYGKALYDIAAFGRKKKYEGEWKDGQREGKGIAYDEIGLKEYEGEFKNDMREGIGILYNAFVNKKYEGEFKNDKREGIGILYDVFGNKKYEGEWRNDKKNGYGIMYYPNGERYEGNWVNNRKEGLGTWYYKNGDKCEVQWRNNSPIGKGTYYTFENGEYKINYEINHRRMESLDVKHENEIKILINNVDLKTYKSANKKQQQSI